ncbi:molecular chaperone GrpE [Hyphomicrobium nitrativorans NL23]|uniref:Protein GrpE n=1 Tax=Hyphomicrobium nitrativorans NL23 TaxID=1029756 RepID=V5SCI4_9HYPH|nr:nucleotide exchange factor GrpE [Hyphomicrobium nitrativorans]AHB47735.1 molecular chaperone GrpE [Hyphomicrobium nitrativorans NL23]
MSDETMKPNAPGTTGGADATSSAPPSDPVLEAERLAAEVDTLQGQIADLTDRLLRAHAEMDNMRKRAEREREETAKYAISKFARDVAGVADNFERAKQAVPADAADQDPVLKGLLEGVTMTEREFLNALEKNGVRRIVPKGEAFNPHLHQAMMEAHNADVAPGTIVEVYQAGYVIDDRVLRPAMVVVAKGGPKPAPAAEPGGAADPDPQSDAGDGAGSQPPPGNDNAM